MYKKVYLLCKRWKGIYLLSDTFSSFRKLMRISCLIIEQAGCYCYKPIFKRFKWEDIIKKAFAAILWKPFSTQILKNYFNPKKIYILSRPSNKPKEYSFDPHLRSSNKFTLFLSKIKYETWKHESCKLARIMARYFYPILSPLTVNFFNFQRLLFKLKLLPVVLDRAFLLYWWLTRNTESLTLKVFHTKVNIDLTWKRTFRKLLNRLLLPQQ